MSSRHSGKLDGILSLRSILVLGLTARAVAVVVLNRLAFSLPVNEPWQIARSLYEGRGFAFDWYGLLPEPHVGSFLPPLYPWMLSVCLAATGGRDAAAQWIAQGVNVLLGTATIWLVARLSEQITATARSSPEAPQSSSRRSPGRARAAFEALRPVLPGPAASRLAALVWAVYPPAVGHTAQAQSQVLETFLLLLLCLLVLRETGPEVPDRPSSARTAAAGLVLGLLLLTRPTMLVIWALWSVWLWITARRRSSRTPARFLGITTGIAALVLLPWTARNYQVHGRLVPVSTNGGFNFYMGNNPVSDGGIPPLVLYFPRLADEERRMLRAMSETARDRHFYKIGLDYWRTQPGRALRGVRTRIVSYVLWRPYLFAAYPRWIAVVSIASYLAILAPFLLALPRCRGPAVTLPLLALLGTGLVGVIWIVSMRFRAAVEPFLLVVGAAGLTPRRHPPPR